MLANNAFYLIGSAVFESVKYNWTMKVTYYFSFFKVLSHANIVHTNAMPLQSTH
jgi:hypothetical protein